MLHIVYSITYQQHHHGHSCDSLRSSAVAKLWECPCHSDVKYSSTRALTTKLPRPPHSNTFAQSNCMPLKHTQINWLFATHILWKIFCRNVMQQKYFCSVKPFFEMLRVWKCVRIDINICRGTLLQICTAAVRMTEQICAAVRSCEDIFVQRRHFTGGGDHQAVAGQCTAEQSEQETFALVVEIDIGIMSIWTKPAFLWKSINQSMRMWTTLTGELMQDLILNVG